MEPIISDLVQRFERGKLSRRELIRGLSMLVATSQALAAEPAADPGIVATGIDHVSILVSNLSRSVEFYRNLFGLSILSEDKDHGIVRLGRQHVIISLRTEPPTGTVDHFGVKVEGFNKERATESLKKLGLTPAENWQYGFYLKDPDKVNVQLL
jgi:catechol 2,3-dioxygenase-like lactoylglutathione lyase family enzyme